MGPLPGNDAKDLDAAHACMVDGRILGMHYGPVIDMQNAETSLPIDKHPRVAGALRCTKMAPLAASPDSFLQCDYDRNSVTHHVIGQPSYLHGCVLKAGPMPAGAAAVQGGRQPLPAGSLGPGEFPAVPTQLHGRAVLPRPPILPHQPGASAVGPVTALPIRYTVCAKSSLPGMV